MNLNDKIILGIDTSCYTTSIAAINLSGNLLLNKKIQLAVRPGERGLRQSEGLFQHVDNMGKIFSNFRETTNGMDIAAICASSMPRPQEGSYMPVFNAGVNFARAMSQILGVSIYQTTHQEGHIKAVAHDCKFDADRFVAVHISGGTTEILLVQKKEAGFGIDIVGGTKDISAGQLLDRVGVKMGYKFPAGRDMDQNAMKGTPQKCIFKISASGGYINLSGVESQAYRMIGAANLEEYDKIHIAYQVLKAISIKLSDSIRCICEKYECKDVLFAGGVASSIFLKSEISGKLCQSSIKSHWSTAEYSADNAAGVALIGRDIYFKNGDE